MSEPFIADEALHDKVAVVTGAGRGIGLAIVDALAAAGCDVAGCARSADELERMVARVEARGRRALGVPSDVSDWAAVTAFHDAVMHAFERVDILVNNAGGSFDVGPLADSSPDAWRTAIDVNLVGTYNVIRAFVDDIPAHGKIINIASGMGLGAVPGNSSYAVAKAGVHMLTQVLALEIFDRGIEVNDIIPGLVATTNVTWASDRSSVESVLAEFDGKEPPFAPSERVKHPDEVGELVRWVASLPPGGPTGQSFSLARRPF